MCQKKQWHKQTEWTQLDPEREREREREATQAYYEKLNTILLVELTILVELLI